RSLVEVLVAADAATRALGRPALSFPAPAAPRAAASIVFPCHRISPRRFRLERPGTAGTPGSEQLPCHALHPPHAAASSRATIPARSRNALPNAATSSLVWLPAGGRGGSAG